MSTGGEGVQAFVAGLLVAIPVFAHAQIARGDRTPGNAGKRPYDLCVFVNGAASPMDSMPEFWQAVQGVKQALERSPGCKASFLFSASGDPKAKDMASYFVDSRGMTVLQVPPFSGLPAKISEVERVFREEAPVLARVEASGRVPRTFIMFEGHGGEDGNGEGIFTFWRELLTTDSLKTLLRLLPGQKLVYHDSCSAGSMFSSYLDLQKESEEKSGSDPAPSCGFAISANGEEASAESANPLVRALSHRHGLVAEGDSIAARSKLSIIPMRTSDAYFLRYLKNAKLGAGNPGLGAERPRLLPDDKQLKESMSLAKELSFPLLAARLRTLESRVRKNLDEIHRPSGDSDVRRAYRLYADLQTITASAQSQVDGAPGPSDEQKDAFLKAEYPDLHDKFIDDILATGDADSPEKRELEWITGSITCDTPKFPEFAPSACASKPGALGQGDVDGLQGSYKTVRRAYGAAQELVAASLMVASRDLTSLRQLEALLTCESAIGN